MIAGLGDEAILAIAVVLYGGVLVSMFRRLDRLERAERARRRRKFMERHGCPAPDALDRVNP